MTAAPSLCLSQNDDVGPSHPATCDWNFGMSSRKFSQRNRVLTYRQQFAGRWSDFIRTNFESPEHAAMIFGVDGSTAKKWWAGSHAPSGFAVGYAYEHFRDQALCKLNAVA